MTLEGCKVQAVLEICPFSNGLTRNMVQCLYDYDIPLYLSHTITPSMAKTGSMALRQPKSTTI